jgi:arylsulfatase A-like enzyme
VDRDFTNTRLSERISEQRTRYNGTVDRRTFLLSSAAPLLAQRQRRPNIVFLLADDLGVGDLGCYGQKIIRTPNIDSIAADGMRFGQAYAGCTVCAPSRSVLMTGLHMGHTSVRSNPGGVPLLPEDYTAGEMFKAADYRTGCFGKWGLGDLGTEGEPLKQGFDEFFGYLHQVHAHWYYPEYLIKNGGRYPLKGNENGKRTTYSHDAIAEHALDFIRRSKDDPFFCYVPFTIPHLELLVPEDSLNEYKGKIEDKPYVTQNKHYADQPYARSAYAGMVTRMDRDIGRILKLLRELKLEENTIVFFSSDNGGATRLWGDDYFRSTLGLRGHKQNFYEGGIRTALVARWPGRIARGSASDHQCGFFDMMATWAELAGIDAPKTDGISFAPALLGKGGQRRHEFMYWELPRHIAATGEFRKELPMAAVRMGEWKAVRPKPDAALELYNLKADPFEERNVAGENPRVLERIETYLKTVRTEPRMQKQPPHEFRTS